MAPDLLLAIWLLAAPAAKDGAARAPKRPAAVDAGLALPEAPNLEVPGLTDVVDIPGEMNAQGIPVRLRAFRSKWKVDELLRHYLGVFERAHLFVDPNQKQLSRDPQLTALDPVRMVSYTVVLQASGSGTTVVLGQANLGARQGGAASDFAPVMPAAEGVVRSDVEGARTLGFMVRASEEEVLGFYREVLGKAGYKEREKGTFQRRGEELRLFTEPRKDGQRSVMLMSRGTVGEPPVPDAPAPKK